MLYVFTVGKKTVGEIAHHGKNLIAAFRDIFASTNKVFILAGWLGTRLSFYEF